METEKAIAVYVQAAAKRILDDLEDDNVASVAVVAVAAIQNNFMVHLGIIGDRFKISRIEAVKAVIVGLFAMLEPQCKIELCLELARLEGGNHA